jgi:hypothetical protein
MKLAPGLEKPGAPGVDVIVSMRTLPAGGLFRTGFRPSLHGK